MSLTSIAQEKNLRGKRVLVRLDFNVPIAGGKITDDFRIIAALPTITLLRDAGAKIIAISHIEGKAAAKQDKKSKNSAADAPSLAPVAEYLVEKKVPVTFVPKYFTVAAEKTLDAMKDGDMVLFENLRINKGEKNNDEAFAQKLAAMADLYVNEAFPVSHRAHASIVGVPKFLPSFAGPNFMREVKNLSQAFTPERPFLFVLGGAKFDTKMPLIEKFLGLADFIFVGGALANNFFKELHYEIGESTVSEGDFHLSHMLETKKVFIPTDVVTGRATAKKVKLAHMIGRKDTISDAGPESLVQLADIVSRSKFILWNGPLGNYEDGFSDATLQLADIISKSRTTSIVGGGDTVAAIQSMGLMDKFTFVSTGGGAMLDFLANETLPGIEALEQGKE